GWWDARSRRTYRSRRRHLPSCYLTQWSSQAPIADITSTGVCDPGNGDGLADLSDFSCYLTEWSAGCP
ncbi:MAG: GC-type dockerin domain-anchored protein, partial [Planctomycetota bacterium]